MFHAHLHSPKGVLALILRVSLGLSMVFHGATLYKDFAGFAGMTAGGLGPLAPVGTAWAYLMPALLILGGVLIALNYYFIYGVWLAGLALGSIPAGMLVKPLLSATSGGDMMGAANNAFIWLIMLTLVVKLSKCCCGSGECKPGEGHGGGCC